MLRQPVEAPPRHLALVQERLDVRGRPALHLRDAMAHVGQALLVGTLDAGAVLPHVVRGPGRDHDHAPPAEVVEPRPQRSDGVAVADTAEQFVEAVDEQRHQPVAAQGLDALVGEVPGRCHGAVHHGPQTVEYLPGGAHVQEEGLVRRSSLQQRLLDLARAALGGVQHGACLADAGLAVDEDHLGLAAVGLQILVDAVDQLGERAGRTRVTAVHVMDDHLGHPRGTALPRRPSQRLAFLGGELGLQLVQLLTQTRRDDLPVRQLPQIVRVRHPAGLVTPLPGVVGAEAEVVPARLGSGALAGRLVPVVLEAVIVIGVDRFGVVVGETAQIPLDVPDEVVEGAVVRLLRLEQGMERGPYRFTLRCGGHHRPAEAQVAGLGACELGEQVPGSRPRDVQEGPQRYLVAVPDEHRLRLSRPVVRHGPQAGVGEACGDGVGDGVDEFVEGGQVGPVGGQCPAVTDVVPEPLEVAQFVRGARNTPVVPVQYLDDGPPHPRRGHGRAVVQLLAHVAQVPGPFTEPRRTAHAGRGVPGRPHRRGGQQAQEAQFEVEDREALVDTARTAGRHRRVGPLHAAEHVDGRLRPCLFDHRSPLVAHRAPSCRRAFGVRRRVSIGP
ncbi:hypothetical protein ACFSJI_30385 [Streptomyces calvus]|uniref:hypothetical protein n=1 Tax=Streptomyces calvus TaxID=67282 RepID=UPI0036436855